MACIWVYTTIINGIIQVSFIFSNKYPSLSHCYMMIKQPNAYHLVHCCIPIGLQGGYKWVKHDMKGGYIALYLNREISYANRKPYPLGMVATMTPVR